MKHFVSFLSCSHDNMGLCFTKRHHINHGGHAVIDLRLLLRYGQETSWVSQFLRG